MTMDDLAAVEAIAAEVHPAFPEDAEVFAERLALYPEGARMLEQDGVAAGYLFSHPWTYRVLPPLNALLGALPEMADTYYVHDLALVPAARGSGAASLVVHDLVEHARDRGFASMSLVAVNGSIPFWLRHGFTVSEAPELAYKLKSYEEAARLMVRGL
jgi:GNAT superfamily N-acetyltransferase